MRPFWISCLLYNVSTLYKGCRGIYMVLIHMDPPVIMNLKKIRRLMDKFNLSCPVRKANPYRRMAKALKTSNVAENLLQREFECYGPRVILLTEAVQNAQMPVSQGIQGVRRCNLCLVCVLRRRPRPRKTRRCNALRRNFVSYLCLIAEALPLPADGGSPA